MNLKLKQLLAILGLTTTGLVPIVILEVHLDGLNDAIINLQNQIDYQSKGEIIQLKVIVPEITCERVKDKNNLIITKEMTKNNNCDIYEAKLEILDYELINALVPIPNQEFTSKKTLLEEVARFNLTPEQLYELNHILPTLNSEVGIAFSDTNQTKTNFIGINNEGKYKAFEYYEKYKYKNDSYTIYLNPIEINKGIKNGTIKIKEITPYKSKNNEEQFLRAYFDSEENKTNIKLYQPLTNEEIIEKKKGLHIKEKNSKILIKKR